MCTYTTEELASFYGVSLRTMERRIKDLKDQKIFVKTSPGKLYDKNDATTLSELLNFTIPPPTPPNPAKLSKRWVIPPNPAI